MSHSAAISITSRGTVVKWLYPFLIALVFFPAILHGQILSEAGIPYLRNYPPEEFNAAIQTWKVVQALFTYEQILESDKKGIPFEMVLNQNYRPDDLSKYPYHIQRKWKDRETIYYKIKGRIRLKLPKS